MTGFRTLRKQLDDLGYYQPLVADAVPLVEALLHDLLTTTHSLKLCKETNKLTNQYQHESVQGIELKNISKPSASSTPLISSTPGETSAKIIRLQSRVRDLEDVNRECNSIIRRQQVELDDKSKKILKLELNAGNPRAKVITHHDRPLIISDTSKPRIEMTRLIDSRENHRGSHKSDGKFIQREEVHAEVDLVKMYENRNQHLDRELARLQSELDKARKLLSQAEKHWNWNINGEKHNFEEKKDSDGLLEFQKADAEKSSYMIKV